MLATVEKIKDIRTHPNADALELCTVLGFQCIVPKDIYENDDLIVFIQPDTVLPKDLEWSEDYLRYSPKRVKAVRLRKEWSEGIIVSLFRLSEFVFDKKVGTEVSEIIGVIKYEAPLPNDTSYVGNIPYGIPKTDQTRSENLREGVPYGEIVDITLKVDGQSATYGYELGDKRCLVSGRRFEADAEKENRYSVHAHLVKEKLIEYCRENELSLALRGESYGNRIQSNIKNPHSSKEHSLAIFSVYNINERDYENKGSKHYFVNVCEFLDIEHVPLLEENVVLTPELIQKYSFGIKKLPNGHMFEGVVINHSNGSFKVMNKYYDSEK